MPLEPDDGRRRGSLILARRLCARRGVRRGGARRSSRPGLRRPLRDRAARRGACVRDRARRARAGRRATGRGAGAAGSRRDRRSRDERLRRALGCCSAALRDPAPRLSAAVLRPALTRARRPPSRRTLGELPVREYRRSAAPAPDVADPACRRCARARRAGPQPRRSRARLRSTTRGGVPVRSALRRQPLGSRRGAGAAARRRRQPRDAERCGDRGYAADAASRGSRCLLVLALRRAGSCRARARARSARSHSRRTRAAPAGDPQRACS